MMSVILTEKAAQHIKHKLQQQQSVLGLRLATRKSGCTGYAYIVDYADQINERDSVFESHGIKVIVDQASLPFLIGMTIDYVKTNALNEGFEFINPNVKDMCGCGESFSV
jgi:iron-sulfur cluster assembly protein